MNEKLFALTLDLEPDYGGVIPESFSLLDETDKIECFLKFLRKEHIPLTVFVTGRVLEEKPETVKIFEKYGCEFHSHGYSHNLKQPDSYEEIKNGRNAFINYFDRSPNGFRAPEGRISDKGIRHLKEMNFKFDSSIFPSYYPNPFRYLFATTSPSYINDSKILEIPFAILKPLRITFSLSFIKLFGMKFYRFLFNNFSQPDIMVFDSHLHDLFLGKSFNKLPLIWKSLLNRNKENGIKLLKETLSMLKNDYLFVKTETIYDKIIKKERKKTKRNR